MSLLTKALFAGTASTLLSLSGAVWADTSGEHTSASIIYLAGNAAGSGIGVGSWLLNSGADEFTIYDSNKLTVPRVLGLTMDTTLVIAKAGEGWSGTITPTKCYEDTADYCSYVDVGVAIPLNTVTVDGTSTVQIEFGLAIVLPETVDITYTFVEGDPLERLLQLGGQMPE
ncbi:Uncharacterised protein [BD1-7 clade bacterium]|uniref:Uncharacterized protein n=1 Tax=BD1-7 clade bacterium TaxID=2029982 RepID=A0A5S9PKD0_9GAMM|nr:Uncharacterised protein [BD1-7 clade bacterium]CAA0104514.1 Uncharacterised protein [BD1-7 clade bacterium]